MSEGLFSPHWYRISELKPMLRSHVRVERHCYRDEVWYLLRDELSGRQHRLSWTAFQMVGRLDGRLTSQEIWVHLVEKLGDDAPSQSEVITLLGKLNESELIQTEVTPDVAKLFSQRDRRKKQRSRQKMNPLSFRVALGNPDGLLAAFAPLLALFLKPWALLAFLGLVLLSSLNLAQDWRALTAYGQNHLQQSGFIFLLWLVYPLVKLLHELAHGASVKAWGGEVKEFGVTLMMLFPIPYIDASSASAFRQKNRRTVVSLMGIFCELLLACIAYWIWSGAADGLVREIAFAVLFTCSISTILVNANPLMKFDGYYALSDWLESPGLAQRSVDYLKYLGQKYLFRVAEAVPPTVGKGERFWLLVYGVSSLCYRWVLGFAACFWIAEYSAGIALIFALWFIAIGAFTPIVKLITFLTKSAVLNGVRGYSIGLSLAIFTVLASALWFMPISDSTRSEGIVWLSDKAVVRSEADGIVARILVTDMQTVEPGQALLELEDPVLQADLERTRNRLAAVEISYQMAVAKSNAQVKPLGDDLARLEQEVSNMEMRLGRLVIKASRGGRVTLPNQKELLGAWVEKGRLVGFVFQPEQVLIRTAIKQEAIGIVRTATQSVSVRQSDMNWHPYPARVLAYQPESTHELPSAALGEKGGGSFAIDTTEESGTRSTEPIFIVDVEVEGLQLERVGARALVRFEHRHDSILSWLHLQLQRTKLKHFDGSGGQIAQR